MNHTSNMVPSETLADSPATTVSVTQPEGVTADAQAVEPDPELAGMEPGADQEDTDTSDGADRAATGMADPNLTKHGYLRLYRLWRQEWWWKHTPWSYAQLFLWFLMDANHVARRVEYQGRIIEVPRGAVATSQVSLAQQSGLNRKTIVRFLAKMEAVGELKVLSRGQSGIIVSVCHYELYAGDVRKKGQ